MTKFNVIFRRQCEVYSPVAIVSSGVNEHELITLFLHMPSRSLALYKNKLPISKDGCRSFK